MWAYVWTLEVPTSCSKVPGDDAGLGRNDRRGSERCDATGGERHELGGLGERGRELPAWRLEAIDRVGEEDGRLLGEAAWLPWTLPTASFGLGRTMLPPAAAFPASPLAGAARLGGGPCTKLMGDPEREPASKPFR